jgi:predicted transcriptional regulator
MPHSNAQAHPGASENRQLRTQEALHLRATGKTYQAIANQMGVSEKTARDMVKDGVAELNERNINTADDMRRQVTERLEHALNAISSKVDAGDVYAVEKWVMINRELAKLYGLYAPIESKAEVNVNVKGLPASNNPKATIGERIAGILTAGQGDQVQVSTEQASQATVDAVSVREIVS